MINNSQKNMDKSFVASIRFTHDSVVEQWVGTVFTAFIVSILLPHWNESVQSGCEVSVAVAMVHAFCVFCCYWGEMQTVEK